MSEVKVGDEYENWCQGCQKITKWRYIEIKPGRVCVAYDGGGGEYENCIYYTVQCQKCKQEFTH